MQDSLKSDFIRQIIREDLKNNKNDGKVHTRFPPEPNGYLHLGHAKSICLNFGLAQEFSGLCNLRLDDTNPSTEEVEYVESIKADVKWLGFEWDKREFYASDYFQKCYELAVKLIKDGKAFVCSLNADQVREHRGTLTAPGKNSPDRDRPIEESLKLFEEMKAGIHAEGSYTLRAKIDMSSPNINLRDPAIYRIRKESHHRTKDAWCIYPMYDYAHCISDALEGITHSICTLEFEDHRPLYDWFLDQVQLPCHPQQIEFARLNITYTVLSKRKLLKLVNNKLVDGWDDPRMPTLSGARRRGFSASALREFCNRIGVAKADSTVDLELLNFCQREELNKSAARYMAVLNPIKLIIENYPEDKSEMLEAQNNPEDNNAGTRQISFSKELYIDAEDFQENPQSGWFRLAPGKETRLLHAYYVTCTKVIKDGDKIKEVYCTYDEKTKGGWSEDGRKVKGTVHWVDAKDCLNFETRIYNNLFTKEKPEDVEEGKEFTDYLNPESKIIITNSKAEKALSSSDSSKVCQFVRTGYFIQDYKDSSASKLIFNRVLPLKDSWSKKK